MFISPEMEFKICQNAILQAATVDFMTFLNECELVKKHISVMQGEKRKNMQMFQLKKKNVIFKTLNFSIVN